MGRDIRISGSNLQGTFAVGENAVSITFGDQTSTAAIQTHNFDWLSTELKRHHVVDDDIGTLRAALDADQNAPQLQQKRFGPAINSWMQKMLGKAIDTSWQIEISIVGGLLTSALQKYYGW